ncbi:indolepyruvate ferredoxin oxidoreductase family protein [Arenicellales bacterium nBUS_45]
MSQLRDVTLEDKYLQETGQVFVTGIQALVRLPMLQHQLDSAMGLNTAGYVTGYRGSPLGALDQQFALASDYLTEKNIKFLPAVNEDLAATAVWGSQQAGLNGNGRFDGVFSLWYAKGPGVDRSGDPLRHGNLAGTSSYGGVLILMGDDHTCESSTTAHQSEFSLVNTFIPILNPAGVQDILDFGLYGWALSRYSGCWIGLKGVHDTVEASASISIDPGRINISSPVDFRMPPDGLNLRWPDTPQAQEQRLHQFKLPAVSEFTFENPIDRQVLGDKTAEIGIISTGKSYLDVRRALLELGIDDRRARRLGLKVYKVGMPWPLERRSMIDFTRGLKSVIVVEEKRPLIEDQMRQILYGVSEAPIIIGRLDEKQEPLFPVYGRLDASHIALVIGERLVRLTSDEELQGAVAGLQSRTNQKHVVKPSMQRVPYFCAGCPHNTSTVVPEGSRALAGIGCHYMAQWMDRETATFTQMGGEGASWIGESPFSNTPHVFQNIGDGTYFHSGLLAIRACVSAKVNITYKILYNDAVAMTGGQSFDGPLDVSRISRQVHAEGVSKIAVVTDDPDKYAKNADWAPGVLIQHRDHLARVQREMREVKGTTVIIFDQTCAAEKRRRRRRGILKTPDERLFINSAVCEGCGDCGKQSNCVALIPIETDLGRKRAIDQSACNFDYSCNKGFCPSFVSVIGAKRKTGSRAHKTQISSKSVLPEPDVVTLRDQYSIVLNGVGGTGIVTIGAIVGMAAHIAKMGCSVLDMAGLAQKGGGVTSHIILAAIPEDISATHVADGGADLLLGCDLVVSASLDTQKKLSKRTLSVVNTHQMMNGEFIQQPDQSFPLESLLSIVGNASGSLTSIPATALATAVFSDNMSANMIMLGHAYQAGAVPIPVKAIKKAIELNGRSVEMNLAAFELGREIQNDPTKITHLICKDQSDQKTPGDSLSALILRRKEWLKKSHGVDAVRQLENWLERFENWLGHNNIDDQFLREAFIESAFHVLYDKDEYEVARLYVRPEFKKSLEAEFEKGYRLKVHLSPALLSRIDAISKRPIKRSFGSSIFMVFKLLSALRGVRGRWFDPFRGSQERQIARSLKTEFEQTLAFLCSQEINSESLERVLEIVRWPRKVRGYGIVRKEAFESALREWFALRDGFNIPKTSDATQRAA